MLSNEQMRFIELALEGNNVLVDACIGSGKTTSIQELCNRLPTNKKILYLTYNKLLKVDAKNKIKLKNVAVHNYDGFAFWRLKATGNNIPNQSNLVSYFNEVLPWIDSYDILIIDEYQDIKLEHSIMLNYIKDKNPNMQIIAVGDMAQKIYDMSTLEVEPFINEFLGDYIPMEFTQCFRLSKDHASMLSRIWKKEIIGVNKDCKISYMNNNQIIEYLAKQNVEDILCLGSRLGDLARVLNRLEKYYPNKFNKKTVYASIRDGEVLPNGDSAIFTTFDASKGLERKICVIFDFTEDYWNVRINQPQSNYEIIRNIFCVAASRGKGEIIFVKNKGKHILSEKSLSTPRNKRLNLTDVNISSMFDFKYSEDIKTCYNLLNIEEIPTERYDIPIKTHDELIDLSPCIGMYQEAMYFKNYNIDKQINFLKDLYKDRTLYIDNHWSLEKKILAITAFETHQNRYLKQVSIPFITEEQKKSIRDRLSTVLSENSNVQKKCELIFSNNSSFEEFYALGRCDVITDDYVYELKFVHALAMEHYLQCACYMIGLDREEGILWNVRTNEMQKITIPDKEEFLNAVKKAITKGLYT